MDLPFKLYGNINEKTKNDSNYKQEFSNYNKRKDGVMMVI